MGNDTEEQVSFTLRLSKDIRDKLLILSAAKNKSLNSYIQNLLDVHLLESGVVGSHIVSLTGRSFEVVFEPATNTFDHAGYFSLRELRFDKTRARYKFGLAEELADDWGISKKNATEAVKLIGLALLAFYNKKHEIDRLSWLSNVVPSDRDGDRLLFQEDVGNVASIQEFLDCLRQNQWQDKLVEEHAQSQDIRLGRRTEAALYR